MTQEYLAYNQWDYDKADLFWERLNTEEYNKVVIFGQLEWEYFRTPRWNEIVDLCTAKNKPLYVVTGAHDIDHDLRMSFRTNGEVIYHYNTFWLKHTFANLAHSKVRPVTGPDYCNFDYHFISMNNRMHKHRCLFVDTMAEYDLLKYGAVSIHGDHPDYPWKYFNYQKMRLDDYNLTGNQYIPPPQFYKSFMQVVSETAERGIILSEKTAIPLILGKPFLVAAHQGFHKFLTQLGFRLYDEIFDYSFDSEHDTELRYKKLSKQISRICSLSKPNLEKLQKIILPKVQQNKKIAKTIITNNFNCPAIIQEVLNYQIHNNVEIDRWTTHNEELYQTYKDVEF